MASKKSFMTEDPIQTLLGNMATEQAETPVKKEEPQGTDGLDPKEELVRAERKSVRLNLLLTPSLKERLRAESDKTGISVNDIINQVLNNYFK